MKKTPLIALAAAFAANGAFCASTPAPHAPPPQTAPASPGPQAGAPLKGEVLEVIDVEAYTYLRLKTATGEVWAAVGKAAVKKGARVTIQNPAVMENFESKTLKRTFPLITFGTLEMASPASPPAKIAAAQPKLAGAASTAGATAMTNTSPGNLAAIHAGIAKAGDVAVVKPAKAEGASGRTVAEVNADRGALKDKIVAVRATVVKVNSNVMGKNWVHLRDGSGSAADQSNDLLVTSSEEPKVGDVVVAKGVVKTNVDLGSGYAFKVLVENASFTK